MRHVLLILIAAGLAACGVAGNSSVGNVGSSAATPEVFEGPVPRANCGPGSDPEHGLQGQVPLEDRQSGRSQEGYRCNLELVGQSQNEGTSWQAAWYEDCAYYGTVWAGGTAAPNPSSGVQVIDVSNPAAPKRSTNLITPAMLDPWESLKVDQKSGLLASVAAWNIEGPVFLDVYDLKPDCKHPAIKISTPMNIAGGHEGNFSEDGKTYFGSNFFTSITAIDMTTPVPATISVIQHATHGLSTNAAGDRLYLADNGGNGLTILDIGSVAARAPTAAADGLTPVVVGSVYWDDGATAQHTIPVSYNGKPFIIFADEGGKGAARIIDISDEKNPFVVSKLKLEIHMPDNDIQVQTDTAGNGIFKYEAHYCGVDQKENPTAVACGYFQSGIRVFDIRNPYQPREIAYFNPPAQAGKAAQLTGSEHAHGLVNAGLGGNAISLTADWCSAQVRFVKERGELWTTCQDNGFMVLKFTNGVWPFN